MRAPNDLLALMQRRELEEPLPRAAHEGRALVRQVDELVQAETMDEVIRQHRAVGELGLADDVVGARVVEEEVVHQARPPGRDAVRPPVAHVAHQRVAAAVVVARRVVCA